LPLFVRVPIIPRRLGPTLAPVVLTIVLFIAAACGGGEPGPAPTPTGVPAFGLGTPSMAALLEQNAAAMRSAESLHFEFRATIELRAVRRPLGEQPNGGNVQIAALALEGDAMTPDKVLGRMVVSPPGSLVLQIDYIAIGDSGYRTHLSTGEWQLSPTLASGLPSPLDFMGDSAAVFDDAVALGIENVDGTDAYHIQAEVTTAVYGGPATRPVADVWIAVDGSHLVQIEVDTEIGPFLRVQFAGLGVLGRSRYELRYEAFKAW